MQSYEMKLHLENDVRTMGTLNLHNCSIEDVEANEMEDLLLEDVDEVRWLVDNMLLYQFTEDPATVLDEETLNSLTPTQQVEATVQHRTIEFIETDEPDYHLITGENARIDAKLSDSGLIEVEMDGEPI